MGTDIGSDLRRRISERAGHRCEYCHLPDGSAMNRHEPDHIVPRQHGGDSGENNLALACFRCNRYKGPNVGSFDPFTGDLVPLFNPRKQLWPEHFELQFGKIVPLTPEARVTVKLLRINHPSRISERNAFIAVGISFE